MAATQLNSQNNLDGRTYWLDRALEGQTPEVKARVLELVLKMGVDPKDEFFMIFVGMGQLQVLLLDAPERWQEIFSGFLGQLESGMETWEKKLAKVSFPTSEREEGTKKVISDVLQTCKSLKSQLEETHQGVNKSVGATLTKIEGLSSSTANISRDLKSSKERLGALEQEMGRLNRLVQKLVNSLEEQGDDGSLQSRPDSWQELFKEIPKALWSYKGHILSYGLIFLVGFGGARSLYLPQQRLLESMAQRTQWLLEKENRRDCLEGIKPKGSPECRDVFDNSLRIEIQPGGKMAK